MTALTASLRPETSLPEVCRGIAQAFASTLAIESAPADGAGDQPCFAFALAGSTCLAASSGPVGSRCVRSWQCRTHVRPPEQYLLPADEVLARLIQDQSWKELLSGIEYDCIPLAGSDGRMSGGILLPRQRSVPRETIAPLLDLARFAISSCADRAEADHLAEESAAATRRLAQVQQFLAEAQALASVGEMAAGAAHEMNNPLTVISGRAQLLARRLTEPKDRQDMELIVRKADELSELATQLLSFAQPQDPKPQVVSLPELLTQTVQEAANQAQPKPRCQSVDIDIQPDCGRVRCDAQQLHDVVQELLVRP